MELLIVIALVICIWQIPNKRKGKQYRFTDVIVIDDVSTPQGLRPNPTAVFDLYQFPKDMEQQATFRLNTIHQYRIGSPIECYLRDGETGRMQNVNQDIYHRADQVEAFNAKITDAITQHCQQAENTAATKYSEVYRTIAEELNIFSRGSAEEQILIVHSGLHERSDLFDSSAKDMELLVSSPSKLARRFAAACTIGKLKGVSIVFAFMPENKTEEALFLNMVQVYKCILDPLGATIHIQSANKAYDI